MDMGYQSWYTICACLTLKTVLEEKQPNLTLIYLMHVQIYMYMYIYMFIHILLIRVFKAMQQHLSS